MALKLKTGEVHTTGKKAELKTGFIVLLRQNVKRRTFGLGIFIDQATFELAAASDNEDNFALEQFSVTMSPTHFVTYLYTTGTYTAKPLDIINSQFFSYLLTEKPAIQGAAPYLDWNDWELASVPGVPFTAPGGKR